MFLSPDNSENDWKLQRCLVDLKKRSSKQSVFNTNSIQRVCSTVVFFHYFLDQKKSFHLSNIIFLTSPLVNCIKNDEKICYLQIDTLYDSPTKFSLSNKLAG